jgi:PAS domain S-box-containing protein
MEGPTQDDPPSAQPDVRDPEAWSDPGQRAQRLATVFERSSNPMLLADDDRVFIDANAAALRVLDLPREAVVGRRIDDLAAPHLREASPERWDACMRLGSAAGSYEYIGGEGKSVPFDYSATANILPGTHLLVLLQREKRPVPPAPSRAPEGGELTPREREVLRMVAMGMTGQDIAAALVVSPETVSTHVRNIREKLGARSRAHALALALRRGEIEL